MFRSLLIGCGGYLPERCVTNDDLSRFVETSHEWIVQRTGIEKRYFAADGEFTSDLGAAAARIALKTASLAPHDLDLLVLATVTPDKTFPATATIIQHKIGMKTGVALDVNAACAGFITALSMADAFIKAGQAKTALVIGAETFSRIMDMTDRRTCVLFGDGAGAVVLRRGERLASLSSVDRGILGTSLRSDGAYHDILYTDGGPSSTQKAGVIKMEGKEVFRHAVTKLAESAEEILKDHGVSSQDINWLVPHQANNRILEGLAKRLHVPSESVVRTVSQHANTSAASIPLALYTLYQEGRLKERDLILHSAFGGGLVWGSALVRW